MNHIETEVTWTFVGIYGEQEADLRWHTWDLLNWLGARNLHNVLLCGDFNETASNDEKLGGCPRLEQLMDQLRNTIT